MSRRKITRQIVETHGVRRSPRLSSRYLRSREIGEPGLTPFPLASVAYTATSRQSLGSYKALDEQTVNNILDESGQSVPPSFEEDEDFQSTGADLGAATAQHYGTPPEERETESGMPQHLYGLDDSDDESTHSDVADSGPRVYHHYSQERVLTPPKDAQPFAPSGFCWRVMSFFLGILYKLGSLFYLAATAILCLDVMILHRLFTTFHSMAGGMEGRPTLSWHRFWILPVTLCALIIFLIGGGLFPQTTVVEPNVPGTSPFNYSDLVELRAQILRSITASMQKEMSTFHSSLSSEMENHVEKHIEKAILASEAKLETALKDQFNILTDQRQVALKQLQWSIWKELNSTLDSRQLSLQSSFEVQLSSLRQFVMEQVDSRLTEAMVIEVVRKLLTDQLSAAKKEWIAEADQKFRGDINMSTTSLKKELLVFFNTKYEDYSNQLLDFQSKFDWSSLVTQVQELEAKLQATSSDVSTLKHNANRHEKTVQHTLSETATMVAELKQSFLELSKTLEEQADGAASKTVILSVFNEELDKVIKEKLNQGVPGSGLTRKEVEQLIDDTLAIYSADRIAKFDFALEDAGGSVVTNQCSKTYTPTLATVSLFGIPLWHVSTSPKAIIQPQVYPGDCWAYEGSKGHALIRLKDEIVITGVTLEHIPRALTPNGSLTTAPHNFTVWGKNSCEDDEEGVWLGDFAYEENGPPIQEYTVEVLEPKTFGFVLFQFLTNHGNEHYTCVYRVRVHGHYLQEKY